MDTNRDIEYFYYENVFNNNQASSRVHLPKNRRWQYTFEGRRLHNEQKNLNKKKNNDSTEQCSSSMSNTVATRSDPFQFKLASYNLLAPSLLSQNFYLYRDLNQTYTDWNYRKAKLYDEIKQLRADIYCFQEMQEDQYSSYFQPRFKQLGYKCYFMKRQGNDKQDGCCIIFKWRKFRLAKLEYVDFCVSNMPVPVLDRQNVGIILLLEPKWDSLANKRICVATTHILYNPKRGDCKLAQLQYFLAHIDLIAFKCVKRVDDKFVHVYNPIIFCGDFNCDFRSKFYEFISNGKLTDYKNLNRNLLSGQLESTSSYIPIENNLLVMGEVLNISDQCQFKHEVTKRISDTQGDSCQVSLLSHGGNELRHSFDFESVYKHHNEEMSFEITTCLKDTKKTVDYIFFHNSENKNLSEEIAQLNLLGRLELFKMNQIEHVTSLPIKNYPSDHFMIAARFSIT